MDSPGTARALAVSVLPPARIVTRRREVGPCRSLMPNWNVLAKGGAVAVENR